MNKWSKGFWADLLERVGSTLVAAVITVVTTDQLVSGLKWEVIWAVVVLPTVLTALKGIAANMANPASGASLLEAPPGPTVRP